MRTTTSSPLFRDAAALSSPRQQRQQQQQQQRAMTATHSNSVSSSSSPSKQQQQLPSLRLRMKHFAKIVHPDVLGPSVPSRFKENNQNSLAELNGVLDSITKEKKFPKTGVKKLKFYYVTRERKKGNAKKNKEEEEEEEEEEELVLREAKFTLKTNGGDCRNVLKQSLQRLFAEVLETSGSAGDGGSGRSFESRGGGGGGKKVGDFTWEASDWANEGTEEHQERERSYEERERQTEEYERMVAQREREERINASSNNKSNDRSSDSRATSSSREAATDKEMKREQRRYEKLQEDLRNMDPLFEGIAFVPWLPDNEAGKSRKLSVAKEVVPKLQKNGWNLKKESLKEVWRGQRDRSILLEGLDGASAAAMHAILRHSEIAEKQLGPPVMSSVDTFEWFD